MTDKKNIKITVDDKHSGQRLDIFLADRPEISSRSIAQQLISAGGVTVDGISAKKNQKISAGQKISFLTKKHVVPVIEAEHIALEIVYEDEEIIVVSKPAGMVTHPAAGNYRGTLVNALLAHTTLASIGSPLRPGIIHRLDKDTSGLLVVAKTDNAYTSLVNQLKNREMKRYYQLLVEGSFTESSGDIIAPVGRSMADRKRMAVSAIRGREAVTHFNVIRRFGNLALLEACLDTGRTHQIRVHMRFINHHVVGDPVYGSARKGRELGIKRQFLHAWRLDFNHPTTNKRLSFTSALPNDLANALNILKKMEKDI